MSSAHSAQVPPPGSPVPHVLTAMHQTAAELAKVGISKERINKEQGFKFRGIDQVMNTLAPILVRHGLLILPRFENRTVDQRVTKAGGTMFNVTVTGTFRFVSALDGSEETIVTVGEGQDTGDKATNKAMAIAYKYAVFQGFCIPLEATEDPDSVISEESAPDPTRGSLADLVEEFKLRSVEAASLKELADIFAAAQAELKREAVVRKVDKAHLIDSLGGLTKAKDEAKLKLHPTAQPAKAQQ